MADNLPSSDAHQTGIDRLKLTTTYDFPHEYGRKRRKSGRYNEVKHCIMWEHGPAVGKALAARRNDVVAILAINLKPWQRCALPGCYERKPIMTNPKMFSGCAGCPMTRRRLLATGCAVCAGTTGILTAGSSARAAEAKGKMRIRILYSLHAPKQPRPDWPNIGFDFEPVMHRTTAALKSGCPDFEFLTSMAKDPETAAKIVEADKTADIAGYIVYQMNCWNRVVQTAVATGKPTLYVDFQYGGSGGFLVYTASYLRAKTPNVGFVASSRMEDVIAAARCFEMIRRGSSPADFAAATAALRKKRTPAAGDMTCTPDPCPTLSSKECLAKMKQAKILVYEEGWPKIH